MKNIEKKQWFSFLILLILLAFGSGTKAQYYFQLNPDKRSPDVVDESKTVFAWPWAGGMNACQFGEIDLNLDGIKDLFVFDRVGNRILNFINGAQPGSVDYSYAPEYSEAFPELYDWVILKDYNNDGREDIFTYSKLFPGIVVYKNVSETSLAFELEVYPYLTSYQGGGQVNILTTGVDYPGIEDIDGDGDIDILTFHALGSFVEYHQNQSMEKYGIPDSLDFVEVTQCWGRFTESDESNAISLDSCQFSMGNRQDSLNPGYRHTGSTFLLLDLDADNDKDLLLGDVDYPELIELINDGSPDTAFITSFDTNFPAYNKKVEVYSFPAAAYIDVNNDSKKDLLISPFDPSLIVGANLNSVWLYTNSGENNNPYFNFAQKNFLQDNTIDVGSGAYPVLADWDGDGLEDLFIANWGYYIYSWYDEIMALHSTYYSAISLFRNSGTASNPKFTRITHNLKGLENLMLRGLYATFGDLDGDGDEDMFAGSNDGTLMFLENIAGPGQPMDFADPVLNYQGIDVGNYSTPQLFDLDGDNLKDLIIGEENGNLNYYRNTGTVALPHFILVTDSLGKVNVTDYTLSYTGYSTPCFFNNQQGATELIVGSESGKLHYYKDIDGNLEGTFTKNDSLYLLLGTQSMEINSGIRTGAAISDLNNDGQFDLIVGNYAGGLNYYSGAEAPWAAGLPANDMICDNVKIYPNPTKGVLNIQFPANVQWKTFRITLFDAMHRIVLNQESTFKSALILDISNLTEGIYLCRIIPEHGTFGVVNKKVVVVGK